MSDVQRYDLEYHSQFGDSYLEKAPDGEWIRAEDYDEQTKRIEELEHEVGQYEWLLELAKKRIAELETALRDAAKSLETLSLSGARDSDINDFVDVRGYANNRTRVARAALDVTDRQQFAGSVDNSIKEDT